ncbi:uncharacterized protein LOC127881598 isoform X2 [Dreissena polymorpha]|uniref:uncharacterized protein LOC127881598 isoform X2 n=1 Tax=Dreissena polymorpha TaxID=45954 RepID=UPI002263EBBC|nr:uncharacterized protein LOC127881598 isoform X2 [Dreissena polymorpha]
MGSTELYFFEQHDTRKFSRRYRKLPEELPESLRFAHLNPKVAALLASKERAAKMDSEDPFGDGLGKKSLLPDINAAFTNVRNQFDSALCNDEDSQRYLFEEAKMSATNILHQLSQIIYRYEELHKHIPKSLEYHLMSGYNEFTADTVVVPREWQTQEMKEQYVAKLAHENAPSEDEVTSDNEMLTGRSKSRMGTDRSSSDLKTNLKRNKAMLGSIETINEIEVTRADLKPGRRSESRMSSTSMMRQHLGVETASRAGSRRKGSISGPSPSVIRGRRDNDLFSLIGETLDARSTTLGNPMNSFYQTINFQLSNPSFEEKGWIMLKGRQEEVDQNQILQYCVQRLQESLKDIAEQKAKEVDQGNDKPVFVRYYGDTKKETLLKYRKSPVKSSVNPISRGGKPKIPSISDERNEGRKLMQAQHNDGTTVVYYPSGRPAVIFTGAGFGRPGYYTIVYEDGLDSRMIACFTPSGRGVCHYANGVVRFLSTEKGGHIATEDGKIVQKWKWPQTNVKITEPINVQVNNHVMFRCVGLSQMSLVFSCQKEVARFTVGLTPEAELRGIEDGHKRIWDQLLTAFTFSSKAAKDLMRIFAPNKKSKKKARKKLKKSLEEDSSSPKQVKFDDTPSKVAINEDNETEVSGSNFKIGITRRRHTVSANGRIPYTGRDLLARRRYAVSADCRSPKTGQDLLAVSGSDNKNWRRQSASAALETKSSDASFYRKSNFSLSPTHSNEKARNQNLLRHNSSRIIEEESISDFTSVKSKAENVKKMVSKSNIEQHSEKKTRHMDKGEHEIKANKRAKSAKPFLVSDSLAYSKKIERKPVEKPKPKPEISKESNLVIQLEAYPERWMYRKAERENERSSEISRRPKMKKSPKVAQLVNKLFHAKLAGKHAAIHSAKERSSDKMTDCSDRRRSQSAQVYSNYDGFNGTQGNLSSVADPDIDLFSNSSHDLSSGENAAPCHDNRSDCEDSSMLKQCQQKRQNSITVGSTSKIPNCTDHAELRNSGEETGSSNMLCSIGTDSKQKRMARKLTPKMSKIPKMIITNELGKVIEEIKNVKINDENKEITQKTISKQEIAEEISLLSFSDQQVNIEIRDTHKSKSDLSQQSFMNADEIKLPQKFDMFRAAKRMSMQMNDNEENKADDQSNQRSKGRKMSSVMKSIMEYRKTVLAKKGIILETDDEDSSSDNDSDTHTSKSQSAEILKLLQDFPDKVTYEIEADKELAKLQRKARILVDDWMEHYRIAVGLVSPTLLSVRDTPTYSIHARNVKSARHSDHQLLIRRAVLGVADDQLSPRKKMRIPSAPLAGLGGEIDEDLASRLAAQHQPHDVYDDEPESGAGDEAISPSAMVIINRMTENASRRSAKSRASTAKSVSPSRQHTVITAADQDLAGATAPGRSHCPLVIRQQKLGYERPQCRCSRHYIPNMMDLELDDFVDTECPEGQLIVIMVVSSLKNIRGQQAGEVEYSFYFNKKGQPFRRVFPGITKAEEMVNEIYQNQNRNRTRPCVQSRSDMFRVFKYDINSAAEMSDHTQPFLLTRHNVVPGMFLIFCDGKLLFCDHIFNGYGNTRKDFKKQIMKSRHDAINGFSLPKDFRFSPSKGKSGMRSAWGGEIGGAGVDKYSSPGTVVDTTLQPIHRPNSNSTAESREIHLDAVKLQEACFISMSLSTTGFQPASRHLQSSRTHIPPV